MSGYPLSLRFEFIALFRFDWFWKVGYLYLAYKTRVSKVCVVWKLLLYWMHLPFKTRVFTPNNRRTVSRA